MCAGKKQQKQETVTVVTASTMQYLTQHPNTQKEGYCSESLSVVNSCRETPGPIPNPEAKPAHADGTATGRLWESKSPPTPNNNKQQNTETKMKETANHRLLLSHVLREQAIRDDASPHSFIALRRRYAAHTWRGSSRQQTLNLFFYPRCWLWCDSGDPCGFRVSYSNINTPTQVTCPPAGLLYRRSLENTYEHCSSLLECPAP